MIYLAIPYTFDAELSFKIANKVAAKLMNEGNVVFSPISHSHVISNELDEELRYNQEFWLKQDLEFLRMCDKIVVVMIGENGEELVERSRGCMAEIDFARDHEILIEYYRFHEYVDNA